MWHRGKLIAFSGIDGAGKSTQIKLLLDILKNPLYLWTRGGYTGPFNMLKNFLRRILGKKMPPPGRNVQRAQAFQKKWIQTLWLWLAIFDLMLVYGVYVRWCRLLGRIVVADRYFGDTFVDFRLNFHDVPVETWCLWKVLLWVTPTPDASFLLIIPVEESLERSKKKHEPFPDSEATLHQRMKLYRQLSDSTQWHVIDCMRPIEQIHQEICHIVEIENAH